MCDMEAKNEGFCRTQNSCPLAKKGDFASEMDQLCAPSLSVIAVSENKSRGEAPQPHMYPNISYLMGQAGMFCSVILVHVSAHKL